MVGDQLLVAEDLGGQAEQQLARLLRAGAGRTGRTPCRRRCSWCRIRVWARSAGRWSRSQSACLSRLGTALIQVGLRCSIVTCSARRRPRRRQHRRHQGDRGRAAADDDDLLAGVVEVLGPELRVHDLAGEVLDAGERRACRSRRSRSSPRRSRGSRRSSWSRCRRRVVLERSASSGPSSVEKSAPTHLGAVADVLVDAELGGGLLDVAQDRRRRRRSTWPRATA